MWCSEDGWRVPDQSSDYANTTDQWAGACIYHKVSLFTLLDGDNDSPYDVQEHVIFLGTNDNGNFHSWLCSYWIFHYGSFFPNSSKIKTQAGFQILFLIQKFVDCERHKCFETHKAKFNSTMDQSYNFNFTRYVFGYILNDRGILMILFPQFLLERSSSNEVINSWESHESLQYVYSFISRKA